MVYQGGWEVKRFGLAVISYEIENKVIRSNYDDKHDSEGSRKTFEEVSERCLFCLFTSFVLSIFDALSNKNRTKIITSVVVTHLSSTLVPRLLHQSLYHYKMVRKDFYL